MLPVAILAAVILPPLLLEYDDLVGAAMLDQFRADRGPRNQRRAGRYIGALADHQHLAKLDCRAGLAGELLDRDHVVLGDLVLFAARADDCEHDGNRYRLTRPPRQARPALNSWADGTRPGAAHYRRTPRPVNDFGPLRVLGN